jgi:acyl-CoA thioesterase II
MSDLGPVPAARPPGTPVGEDVGYAASLDHSVWFHRPFIPDTWHRYEVDSLGNSHSRGLAVGGLYDASGSLIANTSQQALWRV